MDWSGGDGAFTCIFRAREAIDNKVQPLSGADDSGILKSSIRYGERKLSALMDGERWIVKCSKRYARPENAENLESLPAPIRDSMRGIRLTFSISIYPLA